MIEPVLIRSGVVQAKESVAVPAVSAVGPRGNPASQTMTNLAASAFLLRHSMPQIMRPKASQTLGRRIKSSPVALKSSSL
jgi:hypothetical protein